ncbi:hypothetical protein BVY03_03710, partial [bacterium K02(2017)]
QKKARIQSIPKLQNLIRDINKPMILLGDLNATPKSKTLLKIKQRWFNSTENKVSLTYPAPNPKQQIDYVLYRPKERWTVLKTTVIEDLVASDHQALLVIFELSP